MSLRPFFRVAAFVVPLALLGVAQARAGAPARPATPAPTVSPSAAPSPSPAPALQWRSLGPAVSGGRVATVAGSDRDPALFYAGAAGGGVWKSTNAGATWSPVFDHEGTLSIGAIAISPRSDDDVWVGTGEPWPRNDVIPGDGIYHTTDGGKHWTHVGLEHTSQIARVLLDPRDPKRIVVAALGDPFRDNDERGIFRSTDGGATWTKTLYKGPGVGASDVAMDPKNPDVLYAGMWRFRRNAWHLESGGADDGIYKSSDGGATWNPVSGHGLPSGMTGRIALAIAPSDAKRIYALIESKDGLLWRSDDGGATWAMTSSNTLINERPFYYSRVIVDPHDENHLLAVSVRLAESKNGGKTWHTTGRGLHGDNHDAWFSADGRTIIEANDGGVALSHDGGSSWTWRNALPISQFYHVGYDFASPYHACGGLQDNGQWCVPTRTGDPRGILPQDWTFIGGGDGTYVVPDPHDASIVVAAGGGGDNAGALTRWDAHTKTNSDISVYYRDQNVVEPARLAYRFNWETPLAFDPHAAHVLYTAGNVVFRSTDLGEHWTPISADLTRNLKARQTLSGGPLTLDVTGAETFDTILALAPSPVAKGEIWIGTDDGLVQLTRNGGTSWTNVAIPGVDADGRVNAIDPSHAAAGTAYAAVDRHFAGDRDPHVYVTTDFGKTWRTIVNGLPHAEVYAVREDPRDPSVLYAGTGKGVWWSADRGASWTVFPAPLPPVVVRDLQVQPQHDDLLIATHGRGMYVLDDLAPLRGERTARRGEVALFVPRTAQQLDRTTPTVNSHGHDDAPAAPITFWQSAPAKAEPAIEIADARGIVVRRIAGTHAEDGEDVPNVTNTAGLNRVVWDLTADPATPWRRIAPWDRGPESGPPVPSGTYTVRLIRDGKTTAQTMRVLPFPEVRSAASERAGFAFARTMHAELSRLDDALNVLDNVRLGITEKLPSIKDPALAERARGVLRDAAAVEHTISSQPVNDQDDDFLEDLLRERVLTFISDLGPNAPNGGMVREAADLQRESATALAGYRRFVDAQVTPLNTALQTAGVAAIDLHAVPATVKPDPNADEHARRGE